MVEQYESRTLAYISAGAEVDPDEERQRLDEWLLSPLPESSSIDREREELLQAVGLRR